MRYESEVLVQIFATILVAICCLSLRRARRCTASNILPGSNLERGAGEREAAASFYGLLSPRSLSGKGAKKGRARLLL